eukprot:8542882-Alexandrium_andersonii.AAC.1
MSASLVGSEMCIRDSRGTHLRLDWLRNVTPAPRPQGKLRTIGRVSMVVPGGVDHRNTPKAPCNRRN